MHSHLWRMSFEKLPPNEKTHHMIEDVAFDPQLKKRDLNARDLRVAMGPLNVRELAASSAKGQAKYNADSYAWFAQVCITRYPI